MKRLATVVGLLFGLGMAAHAAIPVENLYMGQAPLSNKSIIQSTASTTGTGPLSISVVPGSFNNGGSVTSCRVCATNFLFQISSSSVVNVLDVGTTDYTINGAALGTNPYNTLSVNRDHLGPVCFGAGDTVLIQKAANAGGGSGGESITVEGYSQCGGTNNAGPMQ